MYRTPHIFTSIWFFNGWLLTEVSETVVSICIFLLRLNTFSPCVCWPFVFHQHTYWLSCSISHCLGFLRLFVLDSNSLSFLRQQRFSPLCGLSLHFCFLVAQKLFSLMNPHLLIVGIIFQALEPCWESPYLCLYWEVFFLYSLAVQSFRFYFNTHGPFGDGFCAGWETEISFFSTWTSRFPEPLIEMSVFSHICIFASWSKVLWL